MNFLSHIPYPPSPPSPYPLSPVLYPLPPYMFPRVPYPPSLRIPYPLSVIPYPLPLVPYLLPLIPCPHFLSTIRLSTPTVPGAETRFVRGAWCPCGRSMYVAVHAMLDLITQAPRMHACMHACSRARVCVLSLDASCRECFFFLPQAKCAWGAREIQIYVVYT